MIIVISPEYEYANETYWVNQLLGTGLDYFHIRKPTYAMEQLIRYIGQIKDKFKSRLVLHQHHEQAAELGIERLHFSTFLREQKVYINYVNHFKLSTSVHNIDEFDLLDSRWEYAFLSPVFSSISKPGYCNPDCLDAIPKRKNEHVQLVGLGGVTAENQHQVWDKGADGVALLGSIWQSKDPLKSMLACKK